MATNELATRGTYEFAKRKGKCEKVRPLPKVAENGGSGLPTPLIGLVTNEDSRI